MSEQTAQRETARQIAERIVRNHDYQCFGNGAPDIPWCSTEPESFPLCPACDALADTIESHVASLTADLAQAQQELALALERERHDEEEYQAMSAALAAAEQARDEARKALVEAEDAMVTAARGYAHELSSAARTALLEAAEEVLDVYGEIQAACSDSPEEVAAHISRWLTTRAGGGKA